MATLRSLLAHGKGNGMVRVRLLPMDIEECVIHQEDTEDVSVNCQACFQNDV